MRKYLEPLGERSEAHGQRARAATRRISFRAKTTPPQRKLPNNAHPKKVRCPQKNVQRENRLVVHGRRIHARVRYVHERMGGQLARRWQHLLPGGKARPHPGGGRGLSGAHRRDKQRRGCFAGHVACKLLQVERGEVERHDR